MLAASALAVGCASTPGSRPLDTAAAAELQEARIVLLGQKAIRTSSRTDPKDGPSITVLTPSVTGTAVASAFGTVLLHTMFSAIAHSEWKESQELLLRDGHLPNEALAAAALQVELAKLAATNPPVKISDIAAAASEGASARASRSARAASVSIAVNQRLSMDLSRLGVHFRAKAVRDDGLQLMDLNIFYLPISVPGGTKEASLKKWAQGDYKLYREHVERAGQGAVDVLDAMFFSSRKFDPGTAPDATALLRRTNCYGGDYNAGIPMSAYEAGQVIPTRAGITGIRLKNGDVLLYPDCAS